MELYLTTTECYLSYGITQCYLSPDTGEHTPARQDGSMVPGRKDGRLSWPKWLVTCRDGLPAREQSPIEVL